MNWITVCGGGNGAHALVGTILLRAPKNHIRLYLPLEDEKKRFTRMLASRPSFQVQVAGEVHNIRIETGQIRVTQDPEEATRSAIIIMIVPAFAHEAIFSQLAPYLKKENTIAVLPARSGLEYQVQDILGHIGQSGSVLVGFQTLPWACRIGEFGHSVIIYGTKKRVGAACLPANEIRKKTHLFSALLGVDVIPYQSMLELSLANTGQLIHPGIMYGVFGEHLGETFPSEDRIPLFYASVNEAAARVLSRMSDEVIALKETIERQSPGFRMPGVIHLSQWLNEVYDGEILDSSSLTKQFQTNRSYQTLKVPVRKTADGYRVDVNARYLTEDIPFGLLVTKGIASIVGVETPMIDEVIANTSGWIKKEYLIGDKVTGRDVVETRAPQRYKIDSLKELVR